jgi:hypothetical protein
MMTARIPVAMRDLADESVDLRALARGAAS